ncbi:MAG: chemotaxis response regulator protein-glutamate methylesterase [Acidobacteria bacterium]|nr:chemotaxis response regulator protein-glutamate methylesterase [Acidobacteriota bacterium]
MTDTPLRVLVVDDTVLYRRLLTEALEAHDGVEVVGSAPQGRLALAKLEQTQVDLVLMDVEMPEMNGLEALGHIRVRFPGVSVVMISGSNTLAANATIQALDQGALDFIRKPEGQDPETSRSELRESLRPLLRHVRMKRNLKGASPGTVVAPSPRTTVEAPSAPPRLTAPPVRAAAQVPGRIEVVAIGVSTGGPNALGEVIPGLPKNLPVPVVLVQHMPAGFTASLAEHLDRRSAIAVKEAVEGEVLEAGCVYIAPGGKHMVVRSKTDPSGARVHLVGLNENPPENSCRPSVDVLFRSVAAQYDGGLLAVVMTGMGSDGCEGVRTMRRHGCHCITQSEASCVVYGMPLAVDEAGLSDEQVPLHLIAPRIIQIVQRGR